MFQPWRQRSIFALGVMGLLMLVGCLPPQANFSPGFTTTRINGNLDLPGDRSLHGGPLIVVYSFHRSPVSDPDFGQVLTATAHLVYVGRGGAFSFPIPGDVVTADILFVAPGRLTEVFKFRRTLGVGTITYRTRLKPMPEWRSHYYTFLSPQLQHLITEPRYQFAPVDIHTLSQWLEIQNRRLARPGRDSAAKPARPGRTRRESSAPDADARKKSPGVKAKRHPSDLGPDAPAIPPAGAPERILQ